MLARLLGEHPQHTQDIRHAEVGVQQAQSLEIALTAAELEGKERKKKREFRNPYSSTWSFE